MRISEVRSFLLSYPFPEPLKLPFHGGERTILKRDAMLIRVRRPTTAWSDMPPDPAAKRHSKPSRT